MTHWIHHSRPTLGRAEMEACNRVLQSLYLGSGPEVLAFEEALCERYQRKHAIATNSGVHALFLSLKAIGIQRGDRVSLPSYVCTALLNAIQYIQAVPHIVDTPIMDCMPDSVTAIHGCDCAILPQMFGIIKDLHCPAPVWIEDCAMALGPGAMKQGPLAVTSFYATKMIATGQGGAILTDNDDWALQIRDWLRYDNQDEYETRYNMAMTDLAAALGRIQLSRLDEFLEIRHRHAMRYDEMIGNMNPSHLATPNGLASHPGLFRYWIHVEDAKQWSDKLAALHIEAKPPVYKPLHRYLHLEDSDFPHASRAQQQFLSLPFHPSLSDVDLERVVQALKSLL